MSSNAPPWADEERVDRAEQVDREQDRLGENARQRRVVARCLGQEDRKAGPAFEEVQADNGRLLQRAHRVPENRDRREHHDDDGQREERPHRDRAPEFEHRVGHAREDHHGGTDTEPHPELEALTEREDGLIEEDRLEALAVHRREADERERRDRSRGHRGPDRAP